MISISPNVPGSVGSSIHPSTPLRLGGGGMSGPMLPGDYPAGPGVARFIKDDGSVTVGVTVVTSSGYARLVYPDGSLGSVIADNNAHELPATSGPKQFAIISCDAGGDFAGELSYLYCSENSLMALDVTGCTSLSYLDCSYTTMTALDVTGCTGLSVLYCSDNPLTALDVTGCTSLSELNCSYTSMTALDVTGCTGLSYLYCSDNPLTALDVTGCTSLYYLNCSWTAMTATALDAFFGTLHDPGTATIDATNNPGSATCDPSIATAKGYTVSV